MFAKFFPLCLFHARRMWRAHPALLLFLTISSALLLIALGTQNAVRLALTETMKESAELKERHSTIRLAHETVVETDDSLQKFSGRELANVLNQVADELKLPVDEIVFALDSNPSQPFIRYRATLALSGGYPLLRKFVNRVHSVGAVELESISCMREDISSVSLRCDLSFSAFYQREQRG